jgi:transposase
VWLRDVVCWFVQGVAMARTSCYPSDLTDDEWALVEPLLPPAGSGGRPEKHSRREIVDAVLYVVRTGCAWRQLPFDFPQADGVLVLRAVGEAAGHAADTGHAAPADPPGRGPRRRPQRGASSTPRS